MDQQQVITDLIDFGNLPYAVLIIIVTVVAARLLTQTAEGLGERFTDRRLLIHQLGSFGRFFLYFLGALGVLLAVLTKDTAAWVAVGGAAAVSVGFALKDLVSSLVAGLVILVDRPFQVGDRVTFGDWYGEISHIGLRSVRMITLDDTQVTIPNNIFLTDVVASGNAGAVDMMVQIDFHIAIDQDLSRAKTIVREALTSSRFVNLSRPWTVVVSEVFEGSCPALRLRAKAYVLDVRFEKAFESDVTERVAEAFRDQGIGRPALLHRSV
ncbi:MAG: mechanosensitive ion channel family protein [Holophagae bacterium]